MPRTLILLIAVLLAGTSTMHTQEAAQPPATGPGTAPAGTPYYCVVHPEVRSASPGLCRKCGNPLFPGDPWAQPDYVLDLRMQPRAAKAGQSVDLRVAILEASSREPVMEFNTLQDQRLHLIVVSQDLADFDHLHPEQRADGSWTTTYPLRRPGLYRAFVKFSPFGGLPQVMGGSFATAGFTGDFASSIARLEPDRSFVRTVGDTTVTMSALPSISGGVTAKLLYEMSAGGRPVTDLEPYDAAFGHVVVLSEDALDFLRAEPMEGVPADDIDPHGGPALRFNVTFPRAGRYRTWFQFKRAGVAWTVPFTVQATPMPSAR